jgi:hypothetical protein
MQSKFTPISNHRFGLMPQSLVRMNSTMLRDTHGIRHTGKECMYGEFHAQHPYHPCERHPVECSQACVESSSDCSSEEHHHPSLSSIPEDIPCETVSVSCCNATEEEIAVSVTLEETYRVEQSEGGVEELLPVGSNPVARLSSLGAPVLNPLSLGRSGVTDPRRFLVKGKSSRW